MSNRLRSPNRSPYRHSTDGSVGPR